MNKSSKILATLLMIFAIPFAINGCEFTTSQKNAVALQAKVCYGLATQVNLIVDVKNAGFSKERVLKEFDVSSTTSEILREYRNVEVGIVDNIYKNDMTDPIAYAKQVFDYCIDTEQFLH